MNAERDRILERVRKMLRLAGDAGATEGERDNALRMAHATLAKHNLDLAMAEADPKSKENPDEPRVEHEARFGGWPWARNVCGSIADLFFCSYLYVPNKSQWKVKHAFIGRSSNAITAQLLAEFVVTSIIREALKLQRERRESNDFVRSFGWGAAGKIRERVADLKAKSTETDVNDLKAKSTETDVNDLKAKSTETDDRAREIPIIEESRVEGNRQALVLASFYDTEKRANSKFIEVRYPKLGRGNSGTATGNWGGREAGRAFGATVSLNRQVK